MSNIIDIIVHSHKYGSQVMVVLDEPLSFVYEREGDYLIAEDGGFFSFYGYSPPTSCFQAFGGRKFEIPMKDGSIIEATGEWWDCTPPNYDGRVYSWGVSSIDELNECYVFCSGYVDKTLADKWLAKNEPSNNYYKYDKRSPNFGEHKLKAPEE